MRQLIAATRDHARQLGSVTAALGARVSLTYLAAPWTATDRLRTAVLRLRNRADLQDARMQRMESRMASFEESLADLDAATDEIAQRIEDYEQVNADLRAAIAADDSERAAALAAQSAAHGDALAPLVAKLRAAGKSADAPIETAPLPPVQDPATPADGTGNVGGTDASTDGTAPADSSSSTDPGTDAGSADGSAPSADGGTDTDGNDAPAF